MNSSAPFWRSLLPILGAAFVSCTTPAIGQVVLTIDVGSHFVVEGQSVTFPINVTNNGKSQADISGMNFYFGIIGSQSPSPEFGTVQTQDAAGMLFTSSNSAQQALDGPQLIFRGVGVTSGSGSVPLASGGSALVANVTIN